MSSNSYTIEKSDIGHDGGRYISKSPLSAAKKVASQLFKLIRNEQKYKSHSGKILNFTIRRTTSGGDKKLFEYTAKQIKLAKPITIVINGKTIQYKNKIDVKKKKVSPKKTSSKPKKTRKAKTPMVMQGGGCGSDSCSINN